jgi:hypothetical protein
MNSGFGDFLANFDARRNLTIRKLVANSLVKAVCINEIRLYPFKREKPTAIVRKSITYIFFL